MSEPDLPGIQPPRLSPLLSSDPPRVGAFWLDARLMATAAGVTYIGHDETNNPAMVILLSEGAAADAGARERFTGAVNALHIDTVLARGGQGQNDGRLRRKYTDDTLDDPQLSAAELSTPWVGLAYDASPQAAAEAARILAEVDLSELPSQGKAAGPDYQLPWIERSQPGRAKIWPLPWPGRYDRAGWASILASWLLMLLLAALAVLIAILILSPLPPVAPPPPVPTTPPPSSTPSSQSGSPSPSSASPSPSSASPSDSASPTPSESDSNSASPSPSSGSPSPGGTESGVGSPTPNSKL